MASKKSPRSGGARWITKLEVWHVRAKRYIRRHDGKPFKFRVR